MTDAVNALVSYVVAKTFLSHHAPYSTRLDVVRGSLTASLPRRHGTAFPTRRRRRRDRVTGGDHRPVLIALLGSAAFLSVATAFDVNYVAVRYFHIGAAAIDLRRQASGRAVAGGKPG